VTPRTFPIGFYRALGKDIRPRVRELYAQDSCIATTKVTYDTLKAVGVDVFPLSVKVAVVNRALYDYATEHQEFPEVGSAAYTAEMYGVGIGYGEEQPGRWAGHLVAIAERRWLLDFSIDQATRPEHGIMLAPLVVPVTEQWLRAAVAHVVYRYGETFLYYTAFPLDKSFKTASDWSGSTAPTTHATPRFEKAKRDRPRSLL
jgi:hypothetical protein